MYLISYHIVNIFYEYKKINNNNNNNNNILLLIISHI